VLICHDAQRVDPGSRVVPKWFWGYLVLIALMTIAYHTRIVHL
jgi:hypothetical protein